MTSIEKIRRKAIRDLLNENSASTLQWGIDKGVITEEDALLYTQFALWEIYSRVQAVKAIWKYIGKVRIEQQPLFAHYDLLVDSAGTPIRIEAKARTNDIDTYPSARLSKAKADELGDDCYYLSTFYDGNAALWPITGFVSSTTWTHRSKTAVDGKDITEEVLEYDIDNDLWKDNR